MLYFVCTSAKYACWPCESCRPLTIVYATAAALAEAVPFRTGVAWLPSGPKGLPPPAFAGQYYGSPIVELTSKRNPQRSERNDAVGLVVRWIAERNCGIRDGVEFVPCGIRHYSHALPPRTNLLTCKGRIRSVAFFTIEYFSGLLDVSKGSGLSLGITQTAIYVSKVPFFVNTGTLRHPVHVVVDASTILRALQLVNTSSFGGNKRSVCILRVVVKLALTDKDQSRGAAVRAAFRHAAGRRQRSHASTSTLP